jgi:dUTP pyrophosphatase
MGEFIESLMETENHCHYLLQEKDTTTLTNNDKYPAREEGVTSNKMGNIELDEGVDAERILRVVRITEKSRIPTRSTPASAGIDLRAVESVKIESMQTAQIKTDLAIMMPRGCFGLLTSKSSNSLRGEFVIPGVVDPDFRGEILVQMFNKNSKGTLEIQEGATVAQLVLIKHVNPIIVQVDRLPATTRGMKAFQGESEKLGTTDNNTVNSMYV